MAAAAPGAYQRSKFKLLDDVDHDCRNACTEAKAHGYGPYYAGKDPEYAWYQDRDHDGIVCE